MNFIPVKTPKLFRLMYPDYIWRISTEEPILYLTFDDGPTPEVTEFVLSTLKEFNAKATFFCIGNNIEKHPDIFQQVVESGHEIGNHTQDHVNGWKTSFDQYLSQTQATQEIIESRLNPRFSSNKLFRPPYGKLTGKQGRKLLDDNYKIVMWDVISFDWKSNLTGEDCLNKVIRNSDKGSIIVFHDSKKAFRNMSYALPKMLEHFSEKGFRFESLNFK